tara:strand:+ start:904 stop:1608 length:705 start_codon:yes stop_codon:yes gene_type:complete
MSIVISLYDYTGVAVIPWAEAGHDCYCYDIQHNENTQVKTFNSGGSISYVKADLYNVEVNVLLHEEHLNEGVVFAMAFPVCTDLAVSGAAWFKAKAERDPEFQLKAVQNAVRCSQMFKSWDVPFYIENPISVLSTQWRKPDYMFHPYEYGGYIKAGKEPHPLYPDYIAASDAYSKKTCLWTNSKFKMPVKKPVECESYGKSTQHSKLGGKSLKTKNIRSATPRGFAEAVYQANK